MWNDGKEELLRNILLGVSLGPTARKGYRTNVPMCGCVKHIPGVESTSYRTTSVTGGAFYTFAYNLDTEYVSAFNPDEVVYTNYDGGRDFKAQYVAN